MLAHDAKGTNIIFAFEEEEFSFTVLICVKYNGNRWCGGVIKIRSRNKY